MIQAARFAHTASPSCVNLILQTYRPRDTLTSKKSSGILIASVPLLPKCLLRFNSGAPDVRRLVLAKRLPSSELCSVWVRGGDRKNELPQFALYLRRRQSIVFDRSTATGKIDILFAARSFSNWRCVMTAQTGGQIDTVMQEKRLFPPPKEFSARARIKSLDEYQRIWDQAAADPPKFWGELAREELHWFEPFEKPLVWNEPFAQWFAGGKTNVSYNCLDRNLAAGLGDRTAILVGRRAGRYAHAHLCRAASRSLRVCERAQVDRHRPRRPRFDLHADGARAGDRDARLRTHRRDPFGDLCRLLGRGHRRSQSRCAGQAANHGRLRLAARQSACH